MSRELREEARRREEERAAIARRRERFGRDLTALAARPEGRRFFRWLLEQGEIFAEDYQPGFPGAYRAGQKATAVRLWNLLARHLPRAPFQAITAPDDDDEGEAEGVAVDG